VWLVPHRGLQVAERAGEVAAVDGSRPRVIDGFGRRTRNAERGAPTSQSGAGTGWDRGSRGSPDCGEGWAREEMKE
jgi:hypothetical protein